MFWILPRPPEAETTFDLVFSEILFSHTEPCTSAEPRPAFAEAAAAELAPQ